MCRAPKGNDRVPTIHFQVLLLLVSGRVPISDHPIISHQISTSKVTNGIHKSQFTPIFSFQQFFSAPWSFSPRNWPTPSPVLPVGTRCFSFRQGSWRDVGKSVGIFKWLRTGWYGPYKDWQSPCWNWFPKWFLKHLKLNWKVVQKQNVMRLSEFTATVTAWIWIQWPMRQSPIN